MKQMNVQHMAILMAILLLGAVSVSSSNASGIGREVAIPQHLQDGDEFTISLRNLLAHGLTLFTAIRSPRPSIGRGNTPH